MTNTLTVHGITQPLQITITEEAKKQKRDALDLVKEITTVTNRREFDDAIGGASLLKAILKTLEASREEVKRPILDAGRSIDDAAKRYAAGLSSEVLRLEQMASAFQRKVDAEADRIRRDEEERQRKQREAAELERRQEAQFMAGKTEEFRAVRLEDLARIAAAVTDEGRDAAQRIADQHAEDAAEEARILSEAVLEAQEKRQEEARERAMQLAVVSAAPKAAGASVRRSFDYAVEDIALLQLSRPDLVLVEPKRALILASIANGAQIPGLRVFETTKVHAK